MIRLLPKDVPAFLRRLEHYVWLLSWLQIVLLFAASTLFHDRFVQPIVTLFGRRISPIDLFTFEMVLCSPLIENRWFYYRVLIWVVCPTCLARLNFQKSQPQLSCAQCGDCYDINTLEGRVPTEPPPAPPAT